MSRWTHSICKSCWNGRFPERPAPDQDIGHEADTCCYCGKTHYSGIYYREHPDAPKFCDHADSVVSDSLTGVEDHCPNCGCDLDSATNSYDESLKPEPGDVCCCIHCAAVLTYQDDMIIRKLKDEEFLALPENARLELARYANAVKQIHDADPS